MSIIDHFRDFRWHVTSASIVDHIRDSWVPILLDPFVNIKILIHIRFTECVDTFSEAVSQTENHLKFENRNFYSATGAPFGSRIDSLLWS